MKYRYAPFYLLLLILAACQTLDVPTPTTFNQKALAAYNALSAARQTTSTLLSAGKLTPADAQNVKDQLVNLKSAIDIASQIYASDPQAGTDRLATAITGLTALQGYLVGRQK